LASMCHMLGEILARILWRLTVNKKSMTGSGPENRAVFSDRRARADVGMVPTLPGLERVATSSTDVCR